MNQFVLFDVKMAELAYADSWVLGTDAWQRERFSGHQAMHNCKTGKYKGKSEELHPQQGKQKKSNAQLAEVNTWP